MSEESSVQAVWGAATDAGGRRAVNEDAVLAQPPVFLVADGMGGHVHGAMASAAVVAAFSAYATSLDPATAAEPADVQQVVRNAQASIRAALADAAADLTRRDAATLPDVAAAGQPSAGSTASGAILTRYADSWYWLVFNVGDSRVYRYGDGALSRVSVDHSVVQELVDAGAITDAQARVHPQRNVITRAVGSGVDVKPDFWMLAASGHDRLLLCSDGLVNEVSDDEIRSALASGRSANDVAHALLDRATAGGARDNVSVVVVDLLADPFDEIATTAPRAGVAFTDDTELTLPRSRPPSHSSTDR